MSTRHLTVGVGDLYMKSWELFEEMVVTGDEDEEGGDKFMVE